MKELSIKEKAKRYDKAIELVNSKWHYKDQPCFIDVSEIFPELKETENETIRKWIINEIKINHHNLDKDNVDFVDKAIVWLEKQTNKNIHLLELKAKAYDDAKERMSHAYNQNRVSIGFVNEIFPNLNLYKNQSNNANKVEPKFKIGDWIVFNGVILFVNDIVQDYYKTTSIDGIPNSYGWDIDNGARVWTINEARDGDILRLGDVIAIFKKYIGQEECICYCSFCDNCYCSSCSKGGFEIPIENGEDNVYGCTDTTPATKEQRNILFARMKEAGYRWNEDKKELIKL